MPDDPNFLPDLDLMAVDIDRVDLDATTTEDSQRSTLSPGSLRRAGSLIDLPQDVGGLVIPQSASSFIGGPMSGFGGLSARGSGRHDVDEGVLLDDDLGLMVGEDGALCDELPTRQPTAVPTGSECTNFSMGSVGDRALQTQNQQNQELVGYVMST